MKIDVLGEEYTLTITNERDEPKLLELCGFCDDSTKKIVVDDYSEGCCGTMVKENLPRQMKKTIRHEIVHAFLSESGLAENSDWATNEELVDWIDLQGLKLYKAWEKAGAVDG